MITQLKTHSLGSIAIVILFSGCGSPLVTAKNSRETARVAAEEATGAADRSREDANDKLVLVEVANIGAKAAQREVVRAEQQLHTATSAAEQEFLAQKRNEVSTEAELAANIFNVAKREADDAIANAEFAERERDRAIAVYEQKVARANSEAGHIVFGLLGNVWGVIVAFAFVIGCVAGAYTLWRRSRFRVSPLQDIFVSYRRTDSSDVTGRIFDKMKTRLGEDRLFKDVDSIPFGKDFRKVISAAVGQCKVLIVVIGNEWLEVTDDTGRRRIDDPNDYVHIEIATALARGVPVVPVLVKDTPMPSTDELPDSLKELAFRNGTPVRPDPDFHHDMDRLCDQLAEYVK